jgi:N-methylhydantoinase A/oxoprolinase/acetone carboxylase beta subunit
MWLPVGLTADVLPLHMPLHYTAPHHLLQVIGFDMGGTSTDVSRYAGSYEHVFESTTAGVTIQAPQLDINTVAAGGGSRLFYRCGL